MDLQNSFFGLYSISKSDSLYVFITWEKMAKPTKFLRCVKWGEMPGKVNNNNVNRKELLLLFFF